MFLNQSTRSCVARGGDEDGKEHHDGGITFVITAYTLLECEDGAEVLEEVAADAGNAAATTATVAPKVSCYYRYYSSNNYNINNKSGHTEERGRPHSTTD